MRRLSFSFAVALIGLSTACEDDPPKVESLAAQPEASEPEPPPLEPLEPADAEDEEALREQLLGLNDEAEKGAAAEVESADRKDPKDPKDPKETRSRRRRKAERRRERRQAAAPGPVPALPGEPSRGRGLSDAAFNGALSDWRGVQACIATEGQGATGPRNGALRVRFTIAPDGRVRDAEVVDSSNAFARSLARCVERRARRVEFPEFSGKGPARKIAKFVF
jgi:outer membrane biosynthesis protein TonB